MRWRKCGHCDARWWGKAQDPCWACGGERTAIDAYAPALTSQSGYAPPGFNDPKPALEERDTEL